MEQEKLNPQKPGITQPRDDQKQPHPRQPGRSGGAQDTDQARKPQDHDKSRQVPIEGE